MSGDLTHLGLIGPVCFWSVPAFRVFICPTTQRQVQNGPSPDEMEIQRRQAMEQQQQQQQQQRQESLERRTSTTGMYRAFSGKAKQDSFSTLQIKVSSSPFHCQSPPPDYSHYSASTSAAAVPPPPPPPPPPYAKVISSASPPLPEPACKASFRCTDGARESPLLCHRHPASEFPPSPGPSFPSAWPGQRTVTRSTKQISLSPPPAPASHYPFTTQQPLRRSSLSYSPQSSSPPVTLTSPIQKGLFLQPHIPVVLPVIPAQNGRIRRPTDTVVQDTSANVPQLDLNGHQEERFATQFPLSSSRTQVKRTDESFFSYVEPVPVPHLPILTGPAGPYMQPFSRLSQQLPHSSHQFYPSMSHLVSLPPHYSAVSEVNLSKRTPPYMTSSTISHLSPALPAGHPSAAAGMPTSSGGPPPPPPPPPPPTGSVPPPPPPLPAGGGGTGTDDGSVSGLAAALAGAKLRRVQRHFREKIAQIRHKLDSAIESGSTGETPSTPSSPQLMDEFQLLWPDDVDKVLGQVHPTTCLLDPCPSWLLKKAKDGIGTWILEVVNASLRDGRVPAPLKEAVVWPVLKKASLDPEVAANYRPVANLLFLGKVLEWVVAGQLQALLDETDYLDPFQSGFRPGYGTESALVALYDDLCRERDRGSASLLVLLDLSAAFDTIDHDKTEVLLVGGSGLGMGDFGLVLNGVVLPLRDRVRSLGVLLDPEQSLEAQVTAVARSAFLQLWLIHQLRPFLENDCLATVTHTLVTSQLDFCNALYVQLPLKMVRILHLVQNRAARLLTGTGRCSYITPVLCQLHWLPIEVRAQFKVLVMTYKTLNGLGPGYLKERLRPYMPSCPLRSATDALLREPSVKDIRRPEDGSGGSSPSGASKSDANRTSSGGGGLMEEMNKLLAKRRKAASQSDKPADKKEEESQNEDASTSPSPVTRGPVQQQNSSGIQSLFVVFPSKLVTSMVKIEFRASGAKVGNGEDCNRQNVEMLGKSLGKEATLWKNLSLRYSPELNRWLWKAAENVFFFYLSFPRMKPASSSNDVAMDTLDFDRMKQEILEEVVKELHKVKEEIIDDDFKVILLVACNVNEDLFANRISFVALPVEAERCQPSASQSLVSELSQY
ncbi:Ena/VASP-like protein [Varanus komodoensis]|nr:Ena/VASP-like protein [Varanus komodoensis]